MKNFLIVTILLLFGCASLMHESSTIQILGSWQFIHNKSGCEEVYSFTEQGTLITLSGGSLTLDTFQIDKKPNEKNRYKVSALGISVHGLADCSGRLPSEGPNKAYTFYIEFYPNYPNEMIIYYEPIERIGFGPLKRIDTNKLIQPTVDASAD